TTPASPQGTRKLELEDGLPPLAHAAAASTAELPSRETSTRGAPATLRLPPSRENDPADERPVERGDAMGNAPTISSGAVELAMAETVSGRVRARAASASEPASEEEGEQSRELSLADQK